MRKALWIAIDVALLVLAWHYRHEIAHLVERITK